MKTREIKKRILNLLPMGNPGGVERLCLEVARHSNEENFFYFMWGGGTIADSIMQYTDRVEIRQFSYRRILSEYSYFANYIERNKIDIVLVQIPSPILLLYLTWLKRVKKNIRICTYIHSDPIDIFTSGLKKYQFKKFLSIADGCIAVSKFVASEMKKMFGISRIKVIYNGIDLDRFCSAHKPSSLGDIKLIFVGRLIKEKGVDLLIRALKEVGSEYTLTIVGDGPCRNQLEELVDSLQLTNKISFLGTRNDVEDLLEDADLFVHPAIWNEGFGITIIEAMASGVPCIAFAKGALPEIIDNNVNGFLVEEFTQEAYGSRLQDVIWLHQNDFDRYCTICKNAKERANAFDIIPYTAELTEYLNSI